MYDRLPSPPPRVSHKTLLEMAKKAPTQTPHRLYLSYTGGRYGEFYSGYAVQIDAKGEMYAWLPESVAALQLGSDAASPEAACESFAARWGQYFGDFHIALCCGKNLIYTASGDLRYDAQHRILAGYAPTELQIAQLAIVVAIMTRALNLTIDFQTVRTLYEESLCRLSFGGAQREEHEIIRDMAWLPDQKNGRATRAGGHYIRTLALAYLAQFRDMALIAPRQLPEGMRSLFE